MKKLIVMLVAIVLFVPLVVSAVECPEGFHWVENIGEGYYINGECNAWSEPICTQYSWQWSWSEWKWVKVCVAYSEPVCLGYEQVWVEPTDEGECVADEVEEEEVKPFYAGNPSAMLPKIQPFMYEVKVNGNEVNVSWLSSFLSQGAVLVSSLPSDYALNSFGRVYNGDETEVGQLGGYEIVVEDNGFWTYHQVSFNLPSGTWYVRPASYVYALSADYSLGQEVEVVIE